MDNPEMLPEKNPDEQEPKEAKLEQLREEVKSLRPEYELDRKKETKESPETIQERLEAARLKIQELKKNNPAEKEVDMEEAMRKIVEEKRNILS